MGVNITRCRSAALPTPPAGLLASLQSPVRPPSPRRATTGKGPTLDHHRLDRLTRHFGRGASRRGLLGGAGAALLATAVRLPTAAQDATPGTCPTTTPGENKALAERYWAVVWTAGGEAAVPALLAPDEVHHWGVGGDTVGHEGFQERLRRFLDAFPDIAFRVEQSVAEGDHVVTRWVARATHRGEWLGIPATDRPVEWTGLNVFRIACGQIAESWGEADHLGLLRQLGGATDVATPAATPAG